MKKYKYQININFPIFGIIYADGAEEAINHLHAAYPKQSLVLTYLYETTEL